MKYLFLILIIILNINFILAASQGIGVGVEIVGSAKGSKQDISPLTQDNGVMLYQAKGENDFWVYILLGGLIVLVLIFIIYILQKKRKVQTDIKKHLATIAALEKRNLRKGLRVLKKKKK